MLELQCLFFEWSNGTLIHGRPNRPKSHNMVIIELLPAAASHNLLCTHAQRLFARVSGLSIFFRLSAQDLSVLLFDFPLLIV